MSHYWTTDDLHAGLCGIGDLGRSKPIEPDVVEVERISHTPEQCVEAAIHALVRACQQVRDPAASVKAAAILLDRYLGKVVPLASPPESQSPPAQPMIPMEEWQSARRFLYQEALAQDKVPLPD